MHWHVITLRVPFSAGHRIIGHKGKCKHLHGHNYVARIAIRSTGLTDLAMVEDFGDVKEVVKGWIDQNWDHNMILFQDDPLVKIKDVYPEVFNGKKPFLLDVNPTAEVMAMILYRIFQDHYAADPRLVVAYAEVEETENCVARYSSTE